MRIKKLIAMLCVISLLSSLIALPAAAADPDMFQRYVINDTFDTDLGSWVLGAHTPVDGVNITLEQTTLEENGSNVGVMKLATNRPAGEQPYYQPAAHNDFADIEFNANSKIVIETRFKVADGYNASNAQGVRTYLRFNRPNDTKYLVIKGDLNTLGWSGGVLMEASANGVGYKSNSYGTTTLAQGAGHDWTTVRIEIDGTDGDFQNYTMTVTPDGGTPVSTTRGTLKEYKNSHYDIEEYVDYGTMSSTMHTLLKSLTFTLRQYSSTLYVDSFTAYEERPYINATAQLVSDSMIRSTDAVKVKLTSDLPIASLPEGAVTIAGVDAAESYDAATQTVTLTPKAELTAGGAYTVSVDASLLQETEGIIFENSTSFDFEVASVTAYNLEPVGRVIPGTVISASYDYSAPAAEGTHTYQWQESATGEEGTFTDIPGADAKDFTVTDAQTGKYLRFSMIPQDINGTSGLVTYSTITVPEKMPVASNPELSTTVLFTGIYVSALYDYSDENGDAEGATEIRWYTADSADGSGENEVYVGKNYFITDEDAGKYIKCTITPVANSAVEPRGEMVETAYQGPVADLLASTNMYIDPGFETGELGMWEFRTSVGWTGIDIQTKDVRTGNYALHLNPRISNNDSYGQMMSITAGKHYVSGAWAKKSSPTMQDIVGFWPYAWGGTERVDAIGDVSYSLNDKWQNVVGVFKATSTTTTRVAPLSFEALTTADAYLDDFYFGELLVADIETFEVEPVTIPLSGSTAVTVTSGKVLNQLGTQNGLKNETVTITIPETQGISVNGNNVVISETAVAGTVTAEITCVPSYSGASQAVFTKFVDITVVPHNDPTPKITAIDATGTVGTGAVLEGSYTFYQVDGKADASEIRWLYSESENGVYYEIPGANSLTYTVDAAYADKYIKMAVFPKTSDGLSGSEVRSEALTNPRIPAALNVAIEGAVKIGGTLTGKYTYSDPNRDAEGASTYKWLAADSANGAYTAIPGQTSTTLAVTADLTGKYIKFAVTPVSTAAPLIGTEVMSQPVLGPSAPYATNVGIKRDDNRLQGVYTYNHPHGSREDGTQYQWMIDGVVVSTAIDYVINFNGTKTVAFTVIPGSADEPKTGAPVTVSGTVTGYTASTGGNVAVIGGGGSGGGGGGGGGGGISGGSGSGTGVTSVNNMTLTDPNAQSNAQTQTGTDLDGHWGAEYIKTMAARGVMTADAEGNHHPDELVTREEMVTYLFKTLALEATDYRNEFSDVADGEFAKMLQTMVDNGTIAKDTAFRPGDTISRQEMCKILYISLENAGKLEAPAGMLIAAFEDYGSISEWAIDYVNGIYGSGIMVGVSETHFGPRGTLTKAQAATLLVRIINLIEGEAE